MRSFCAGLIALLASVSAATEALSDDGVQVTPLAYEVMVEDDIGSVKDVLVSALEGRNYSIVNILDVQQGLLNRNIDANPIVLVEFINLTRAYRVTSSDRRFELFAPLRAALFEEEGKVRLLILRPRFIGEALGREHLSDAAIEVLDGFDRDLRQVAELVQSGGF